MLKALSALFRGHSHEASRRFVDANALTILKQQIRDAAASIQSSRHAVALASAQFEKEKTHCEQLVAQKNDLEVRAMAALDANKKALAEEAAQSIALLEDEIGSSKAAQQRFQNEISHLKAQIRKAQTKLRDLQRGERLASATSHTQKLYRSSPAAQSSSLKDAEETLERLRSRQLEAELIQKSEAEMENHGDPEELARKMADQGLGKPMRTTAQAVLERLEAQRAKSGKPNARK